MARKFQSDNATLLEVPFSGGSSFSIVLCKCISRGTIHISPDDDGVDPTGRGNVKPVVDYRSFSNPLDLDLVVELLRGTRQFMSSEPMMEALGPLETSPGADMTDDEELKAWIASRISPSTGHPIGTASLAPRELGGVVGPDLRVHGTVKLSVADNSIMPLIPSTHTSSTAYAIGEKVSASLESCDCKDHEADTVVGRRPRPPTGSRVLRMGSGDGRMGEICILSRSARHRSKYCSSPNLTCLTTHPLPADAHHASHVKAATPLQR